jgi:hypothetical protein
MLLVALQIQEGTDWSPALMSSNLVRELPLKMGSESAWFRPVLTRDRVWRPLHWERNDADIFVNLGELVMVRVWSEYPESAVSGNVPDNPILDRVTTERLVTSDKEDGRAPLSKGIPVISRVATLNELANKSWGREDTDGKFRKMRELRGEAIVNAGIEVRRSMLVRLIAVKRAKLLSSEPSSVQAS